MAQRVKLKVRHKERAATSYAVLSEAFGVEGLDESAIFQDVAYSRVNRKLTKDLVPEAMFMPAPKRKKGTPFAKDAPVFNRKIHPDQVYKLRLLGLSAEKIADVLMISRATLKVWRIKHQELEAAWEAGSSGADAAVAKALFNRAVGYEHQVERVSINKDTKEVLRAPMTEKFAPDASAAIFWLTNRSPDLWKSKRTVENTSLDGSSVKAPVINVFPVISNNSKAQVIDYDALDAEDSVLDSKASALGYEPVEASAADAD